MIPLVYMEDWTSAYPRYSLVSITPLKFAPQKTHSITSLLIALTSALVVNTTSKGLHTVMVQSQMLSVFTPGYSTGT